MAKPKGYQAATVKTEYGNLKTAHDALVARLQQAPVAGADETLKAYRAEMLKLRLVYAKLTGETL